MKGLKAVSKEVKTGFPEAPKYHCLFQSTNGYFTVSALLNPDVLEFI